MQLIPKWAGGLAAEEHELESMIDQPSLVIPPGLRPPFPWIARMSITARVAVALALV